MSAGRIQQLAGLLEGTSIALLELTGPEGTLRLRRGADPRPAAIAESVVHVIPSPAAGVFRTGHPLQERGLAQPGHPIEAGEIVGLIQIGTLLLHVVAPKAGIVAAALATDGEIVGYGTPLIRLEARA